MSVKYRTIYRLSEKYTVKDLCAFFEVSRSGYYDWLKRRDRAEHDKELLGWIRECQDETKHTYGYRRIKLWILKKKGSVVNHKAILRVAREHGLLAQIRRRRPIRQYINALNHYPNLINRDFSAKGPNQKWAVDMTYIPTPYGFVYMVAVIDLYDRFVVGHGVASGHTVTLVTNIIQRAMAREKFGDGLTIHSDQGIQFTSQKYTNLIKENSFQPSMSRRGNPYDNAVIENFFGVFKTECLYRTKVHNIEEVRELADDYVQFYNYHRIRLDTRMTPYEKRVQQIK